MALHVLLARQRSGTGAFGSILDQHPAIRYLGEVFHPNERKHEVNYFNFLLTKITANPERGLAMANEENYREFAAHVETRGRKKNVIIDVKYSSTHHFNGPWHSPFDMPKFVMLCRQDKRRILHLKRRNFLKTFVSGRLADLNAVWHARPDDQLAVTKLTVEIPAMMNYLRVTGRTVNHFDGYLRKYPHVLELEYEVLFPSDGAISSEVMTRVAGFLDVEAGPLVAAAPAFVKQTSDNLSGVLENYEEVTAALKGTEFAWMSGD